MSVQVPFPMALHAAGLVLPWSPPTAMCLGAAGTLPLANLLWLGWASPSAREGFWQLGPAARCRGTERCPWLFGLQHRANLGVRDRDGSRVAWLSVTYCEHWPGQALCAAGALRQGPGSVEAAGRGAAWGAVGCPAQPRAPSVAEIIYVGVQCC